MKSSIHNKFIFALLLLALLFGSQMNAQTAFVVGRNNTITNIPDNDINGVSSMVPISGIPPGATITDIELRLSLFHNWVGDLSMRLTGPSGNNLQLVHRPGAGTNSPLGDNSDLWRTYPLTFTDASSNNPRHMGSTLGATEIICKDDQVCDYSTNAALAPFDFEDLADLINAGNTSGNGDWEVNIADYNAGDTGLYDVSYLRVTFNKVDVVLNGTNADDDFEVYIDGNDTVVEQNGTEIMRAITAGINSLTINAGDGDDLLTANFDGGDFPFLIFYDGQNENGTPGDLLQLSGSLSYASVIHSFISNDAGAVDVAGNSTISYAGLEPVVDNLDAADRTFNFTGGEETISLDAGGTLDNQIDSTLGESVDFNNPTNSLTINSGSGNDTINIEGLDANFDANVSINGDDAVDTVYFQSNTTTLGNGNLDIDVDTMIMSVSVETGGDININTARQTQIQLGSFLDSGGDITINAGTTTDTGLSFIGFQCNGGSVRAINNGSINITANGGSNGTSLNSGVFVNNGGLILTIGTGEMNIIGTGGNGIDRCYGVAFSNANVYAAGSGDITINGNSGFTNGEINYGVRILESNIDLTSGDLNITGKSQNVASGKLSRGFYFQGPGTISNAEGNITIEGTAATGSGGGNSGTVLFNEAKVIANSSTGSIKITGTGGLQGSGNDGIVLENANTLISANGGGVILNGYGGTSTTGTFHAGIYNNSARVRDQSTGAVQLNGTGGNSQRANYGLYIQGEIDETLVSSNGGGITLTGIGGVGSDDIFNVGMAIISATIEELSTGSVQINGTGGTGTGYSDGVVIVESSDDPEIKSNGGDITITGIGGTATAGTFANGLVLHAGTISTIGIGNILIDGTSGTASGSAIGVSHENATIQTVDGSITIIGDCIDTAGSSNAGISMANPGIATANGNIIFTGSSLDSSIPAVSFNTINTSISANNGNIAITGVNGEINTPSGLSATLQYATTNTSFIGRLAPGQSPGGISLGSNLILNNATTLEMEVDNFDTPAVAYDHLSVDGTIDLGGATLELVDNTAAIATGAEIITLIKNTGTDTSPIIGTFSGLPNGSAIPFNGETWYLYYDYGNTNDIVLRASPINVFVDGAGNMVFIGNTSDDDELTLIVDGTDYRISDPNKIVIAGDGAVQDGNDALVSIPSVTGDINIDTLEGDDSLTVNYDGGNITHNINYDGGNQNTSAGDILQLVQTDPVSFIFQQFLTDNAGDMFVWDNSQIIYENLEFIIDNLEVDDRVLHYLGGAETITIDGGGNLHNRIDSNVGVQLEFNNPTNTLSIYGNDGDDTINIEGLDANFDADLFIEGGDNTDNISFNTNATNIGESNLDTSAEVMEVSADVSVIGNGEISMIGSNRFVVNNNAVVSSENGSLILQGNPTGDGIGSNKHTGLIINSATVQSNGTGQIDLKGIGSSGPGNIVSTHGIMLENNARVAGFSSIKLTGIGPKGAQECNGVFIFDNSQVEAFGTGTISISGSSYTESGFRHSGVLLDESASILADAGNIEIIGFLPQLVTRSTSNQNIGVRTSNSSNITTNDGNIRIEGTGMRTRRGEYFNVGVVLEEVTLISNGSGSITIDGKGGEGDSRTYGIYMEKEVSITTNGGGINIDGLGGLATDEFSYGVVLKSDVTIKDNSTGAILINGTAGSTAIGSVGIFLSPTSFINGRPIITGNGGLIKLIGNANSVSNGITMGIQLEYASINNKGNGNIELQGTSGESSNNENIGIYVLDTEVTAQDGNIIMTGESIDVDASSGFGLWFSNNSIQSDSGVINLTGTSFSTEVSAINIVSLNTPFNTTNNITLTSNTGSINTPVGISAIPLFIADNTITNGTLAPGQSPGQMEIVGNLELSSGDTYKVDVDNFTTAGTDYDQIVVNGAVDITDATLTLVDNTAAIATPFDILTIIENDETDAITGTFSGLPNGSAIAFNGETWYIYYDGGDGNDVILRSSAFNVIVDGNGNMVFTDPVGADDELTLSIDGLNYRISDPNKAVIAGEGAIQDGNDAIVPITSVTGGFININTLIGDDILTVNYDNGDYTSSIYYIGGDQNTSAGDILQLSGNDLYLSVFQQFNTDNNGNITIGNNSFLIYESIESTIDNLKSEDHIFLYEGGSETITLDDGGSLDNRIDSSLGVQVEFINPTNSLFIFGRSGNDIINIEGLDANFDANLSIDGGLDTDSIFFQINATDIGESELEAIAEFVTVNADVSVIGNGNITMSGSSQLIVSNNAEITSENGILSLAGNPTGDGSSANNLDGIIIDNATVRNTGTGQITLRGVGSGSLGNNDGNNGILLQNNALVSGTSSIELTGISGNGRDNNNGVAIFSNSLVEALGTSTIDIIGTTSNTTRNANIGIYLNVGGTISSESGTVNLDGDSLLGSARNIGIRIDEPSVVESVDGDITINGTGASGTGSLNIGVLLLSGAVQSNGTGKVSITGTGGASGVKANYGILLETGHVLTNGGGCHITAFGGNGTDTFQCGLVLLNGATIEDTANGALTINGTAGTGSDFSMGISIASSPANLITANSGNISIVGQGSLLSTGSSGHRGIQINGPSEVKTTGGGDMFFRGNGGNGVDNNEGISLSNSAKVSCNGRDGLTAIGNGGPSATGNFNDGISIISSSVIEVLHANAPLNISATAGSGFASNRGLNLDNGTLSSNSETDMLITGYSNSNTTTGELNIATRITNQSVVSNTGGGAITIQGFAGEGTNENQGVLIEAATVETEGAGDIRITGAGGQANGINNNGVNLNSNGIVQALGTGSISITGTGGAGSFLNSGIYTKLDSQVQVNGGHITLDGTGGTVSQGSPGSNVGLRIESEIEDLADGGITLIGVSNGLGIENESGIRVSSGTVSSNGGDITINGTASTVSTIDFNQGVLFQNSIISTVDNGSISVDGTGGSGRNNNIGITVEANSQITGVNGTISLTGSTADIDNLGVSANGIIVSQSAIQTTGTGSLTMDGTSGFITSPGVNLRTDGLVNVGGDATITSNLGPISTPSGVPIVDVVTATNFEINGDLRTGLDDLGVFPMSANLQLSNNDSVIFDIAGSSTPGTDFDQLKIMGSVTLNDATFTIVDQFIGAEDACDTIILIDNDGTDPIIGTFNGLAEGDSVTFGNLTGKVSYIGGDGNDFVLNLDDTAPVAICQDISVNLDATGQITIEASDVDGGSTDNCGIDSLGIDIDTFDCSNIGTPVTVTLTVTDVNGNINTCTATVTVEDNEDPIITCAASDTREADPGLCQYTVVGNEFDATFTDNCTDGSIINDLNGTTTIADEILPKGDTTVIWTVDDGNGQTVSCTTVITVEDNQYPVITCAASDTRDTDPDLCQYTVVGNEFDATFTDNCTDGIITNNLNGTATIADEILPKGDTTVVWIVDDGNGQTLSCTTVITVEDNEDPVITCAASDTRDTDPGLCQYTVVGNEFDATFTDNCTDGFITNDLNGTPTIADEILPKGDTTVVWTVGDLNGQTVSCTIVITVEDNEDPVITCAASDTRDTDPGLCQYTVVGNEFDATFTDNCTDGTITNDLNGTATIADEILPKGDTTVVWTVDDGNGQTFICTTVITVEDNQDPVITCAASDTRDTDPSLCQYTVVGTEFDATFTDNCTDGTITNDLNGTATIADEILPKGDTTVVWTVGDGNGQTLSCTTVITVEDNQDPVITCAASDTRDTDPGLCQYTVVGTEFDATFTDNCTDGSITNDLNGTATIADEILPKGDTTVVWTVDDGNGQTIMCTTVITVEDNEDPVITCAASDTRDTDPGLCQYTVVGTEFDATFTDNCTDGTITNDLNGTTTIADEILPKGDTTVVWTVDDGNGQTVMCTTVITVEDNEDPVITCAASDTRDTDPGLCQYTVVGTEFDATFTDNCTDGIITNDLNGTATIADEILPKGDTTVVWTVDDGNGQTVICTIVITVEDNEDPVITCAASDTRDTDPGLCQYTVIGTEFDATFTDNCTDGTITNDLNGTATIADEILPKGDTTVVWTVDDGNGQTIMCTTVITVEDNQDPVITCAASDTRDTDPGLCQYTVVGTEFDATFTDNCTDGTITNDLNGTATIADEILPKGDTTVIWTVDDGNGQTVSCTTVITVEDNQDPVITCAASDTRDTDPGLCQYTVVGTEFDATYTDNCTDGTITNDLNGTATIADEILVKGDTTVVWTVDDGNGQTVSCTTVITVEDNEDPVITCAASDTRDTDPGLCQYTVVGTEFDATFTDNCTDGIITNNYNNASSLNLAVLPLGNTTVIWTVDDGNGQTAICEVTISVQDNEAPVIACSTDVTVSTDSGQCSAVVVFPDAIALDNCTVTVAQTGGLPSGSAFPVGVSTIEYTATDSSGNTAVCSFTITVTDNEPAVAVCQDITIQLDANGDAMIVATDVDGGSTDNCSVASIAIDIDTFTCADVGPNDVTLTVTDVNGNISSCIAVVTVEDVTAPVAVCMDITVQLDPTGTITILGSDVDGGSTDACGIASFDLDIDTFDCSNVGPNDVVLTVTDVNGNVSSCIAVVTVEDVTMPDLVCMDITLELGADGTAMISATDVIASVDDACGINTTAVDIENFDCSDIGAPVTVTVFAVDNNGNLESCSAIVTVVDILEPEVTCPADITVDPGAGNLFYEVPDYFATGQATAVDNCTDPLTIFSQEPAVGTLLSDGTHIITMTAEDEYGNVGTCTFELTVESVLGVDDIEFDLGSIVMYPNPAKEFVILSNPQSIALQQATIYDLTGRLIQTIDLTTMGTEKAIDVSLLATAIYSVVVQTKKGKIVNQLIKE